VAAESEHGQGDQGLGDLKPNAILVRSVMSWCWPGDLKVGYLPLVHTADLIYAKESGIFEENGVSVTTEIAGGGAEAVPLLV
jgi:hypothetical protein